MNPGLSFNFCETLFFNRKPTNMKLKFFSLGIGLCFMLTVSTLFSCKKSEMKTDDFSLKHAASQKIETWLSQSPGFNNYQIVNADGKEYKLFQAMDWKRAKYFAESKTHILPVRFDKSHGELPVFKYLVTVMNDAGNIIECNYYHLITQHMASAYPDEEIITPELFRFNKIPDNFTGAIIKYDLQNKMLLSRHYDSGVATNKTDKVTAVKNAKRSLPQNIVPPDEGCYYETIDWFWQVWVNGILVYEEYVGTSVILICEGGGGGGGGGGNNGPCTMTQAQAQQQLSAITCERFINFNCTPPIMPPPQNFTNWPVVSPRTCSTGVATLHFFAGITVDYTAYFIGTVQKDGPSLPWKWKTFQYSNTTLTNGSIPICFGIDKSITANCAISGDKLNAYAQISYSFVAKILCLSGWTPSPPFTGSFTETFDAG